MRVLSLFDGMSYGQIALRELGIIPEVYYASEIDKYAIKQTQLNFPDTVQIGSVTEVDVSRLGHIDLLLGGSPCQSFSFAGHRNGMTTTENEAVYTLDRYLELKKQGFRFEGESYLFWEYVRILTELRKVNPNVLFLLENVEMGKKWERVISEAIGLHGVHINSALVSAQNRKRIYWTNIRTRSEGLFGELYTDIPEPEDRGIVLRDILEDEVDEKYYVSDAVLARIERKKYSQPKFDTEKTGTLNTKNNSGQMSIDSGTTFITQRARGKNSGNQYSLKSPTLTSNAWEQNNFLVERGVIQVDNIVDSGNWDNPQRGRIYSPEGLCPTLNTCGGGGLEPKIELSEEGTRRIRRITPTEASRLQTIPASYRWECSDSQIYRMTGNGWTIEVIKHILSFLKSAAYN